MATTKKNDSEVAKTASSQETSKSTVAPVSPKVRKTEPTFEDKLESLRREGRLTDVAVIHLKGALQREAALESYLLNMDDPAARLDIKGGSSK